MAYTTQNYVDLINKYKTSDPGLAYAIFNGVSGMGGNGAVDPGALDIALRNAWGENEAKNWIGTTGNTYGNAMFDPSTGKYGYYQGGAIKEGTLEGYDPSGYSTGMTFTGTYAPPGGAGVTAQPYATGTAAGTASGPTTTLAELAGVRPVTRGAITALPARGTGPAAGPYQQPPYNLGHGTSINPAAGATPKSTAVGGTTGTGTGGTSYGTTGGTSPFPGAGTYDPSAIEWHSPNMPAYTSPDRPASTTTPFDFRSDPGYQFMLKEALDAVDNRAAAAGNLNSGATLKALQDRAAGLAEQDYANAYDRYMRDKGFTEGQFQSDRSFGRDVYTGDRNFAMNQAVSERDYNNANRLDARNFNFATAKDARDYQTALDQWNQQFGYNAQNADRSFAATTLAQLANMGLLGANNSGNLAATLAAILSGNTLTGAGAGAAGTVGSANNINNIWSQILSYLQNQSIVNALQRP